MHALFRRLLDFISARPGARSRGSTRLKAHFRPRLEALEERLTPAVVTSALDDGRAGTLRAIIGAATDGATITFDPRIACSTINLTGAITFKTNLIIDGETNNITLSGGKANQIFVIQSRADGSAPQDVINNLSFFNGSSGSLGGAISTRGNLSLDRDVFRMDVAANSGGAVYARSPDNGDTTTLLVTNSNFRSDRASVSGGAISTGNSVGLMVVNSTFIADVAGSGGGAISTGDGATVMGSAFSYDVATFYGGAIQMGSGTVTASTFDHDGAQIGGAISAFSSPGTMLTITGATTSFTNNYTTSSGTGGAIAMGLSESLLVTGGTFSNNQAAGGEGGAIYVSYGDTGNATATTSMTLSNVTFTGNSAGQGGAVASEVTGVNNAVAETVTGCLFNGNQALGGQNDAGGAVYTHNTDDVGIKPDGSVTSAFSSFSVVNSTFYQNSSDNHGGAIALNNTAGGNGNNVVSLTSLTVYWNTAGTDGGGLWIGPQNPPPQVRNSIIASNQINNAADQGCDVFGAVQSSGYNLIGITDGSSGWHPPHDAAADQTGVATAPLDPGLDPNGLKNNGGPTLTIALLNTSIGYHAGDAKLVNDPTQVVAQDQRGKLRQMNPAQNLEVSIGAYDPDAM